MLTPRIQDPSAFPSEGFGRQLGRDGCLFIAGSAMRRAMGLDPSAVPAFARSWDHLEPDTYMADGGRYRKRRHATLSSAPNGGAIRIEPHRPHYQSRDHNPLNGGIARHFTPIPIDVLQGAVMQAILGFAAATFGGLSPGCPWHIEMHQFRIAAIPEGGKPTPEGVHHDGVDYVLMTLVDRSNVSGGETLIEHRDPQKTTRFTLTEPFDSAIVDDRRVAHGVTPIVPKTPSRPGYRDMLVVTFQAVRSRP